MYKVIAERRAAKEINSLPHEIIQEIISSIEKLKSNPRPHGVKKLVGEDGWRIRIRTHRILYTINDKEMLITIYRVKHRKDAYHKN